MKKLLLLILLLLPLSAYAAGAPKWQILPEKSSIEWTAAYGGNAVKGSFPEFTADIAFDPIRLDKSRADVKIVTAKVKSDDKDAQGSLPTAEWFDANAYPLAVFDVNKFTLIKDDNYQAQGTLTIRGKAVPVTLPFSVQFYEDKDADPLSHYARINGEVTLKRLDFGVGTGDWARTDAVADEVKLAIHLEAKQVPPQ